MKEMNNNDFCKEILEFRSETRQILADIRQDIKELKEERIRQSEELWQEIRKIMDTLYNTNKEVEILKAKAGMISGLTAFFVSIIISIISWFIRR
jgi:vacuolar-type H+-ATPase subunit H